jgi:hypothetical protein
MMTKPIRIKCKSPRQIPSIDEIQRLADSKHHVVLQFTMRWWRKLDKQSIIHDLSNSLPDHSVFDSGGDEKTEWITVKHVVNQNRALDKVDDIRKAINAYIDACASLLSQFQAGRISSDWDSFEHGSHCCFENTITGQIVEVPLSGAPTLAQVDPYFFAKYVKSSNEFPSVAKLLKDDFHDAARILDIVLKEQEKAQQGHKDVL